MKFLQSLVCSLTILYVSSLLLIIVLIHEELKIQLRALFHHDDVNFQGLKSRHHHIAHNDSFYVELYNNMNLNYSIVREIEKNRTAKSLSLSKSWQTGLRGNRLVRDVSQHAKNNVLSLKEVSQYTNKILWNRQGANISKNELNDKKYKKRILHVINPFGTEDHHLEGTQVLFKSKNHYEFLLLMITISI